MFVDFRKIKIYLRPGFTDMRKQANGLSVFVEEELELDPLSGNLFLFCNKRRNILKVLYWDRNGFCSWKNGNGKLNSSGDGRWNSPWNGNWNWPGDGKRFSPGDGK